MRKAKAKKSTKKSDYLKRMTFFARKSDLGDSLSSKFLEVIVKAGKDGITKPEITAKLKKEGWIKKPTQLNNYLHGMQKKGASKELLNEVKVKAMSKVLIQKEKKRNGHYFATDQAVKVYEKAIAPAQRKARRAA
jgi:hypothetical protein